MFLGLLREDEKKAFLELAYYVASSDSDFSKEEKDVIATYCFEMQIEQIDFQPENFNLEKTLKRFKSPKSQKIALLEIIALILADNVYHVEEKKIIKTMLQIFELNEKIFKLYFEWTKSILAMIEEGKLLLEL